jgi:DNA-binding MarR family transcriptional regulator
VEEKRCEGHREDIIRALEQGATLIVRHVADRQGVGQGLSHTAAMTLARLEAERPVRLTALAAAEGVSQPAMTQLVQRLEREGLVNRVSDPDDGRAALVGITEAGRALLIDRRRARHDRLAELLATLPPGDEATLGLALHVALPLIRQLIHNSTDQSAAIATSSSARVPGA